MVYRHPKFEKEDYPLGYFPKLAGFMDQLSLDALTILNRKLIGHYNYYGVNGNYRAVRASWWYKKTSYENE